MYELTLLNNQSNQNPIEKSTNSLTLFVLYLPKILKNLINQKKTHCYGKSIETKS